LYPLPAARKGENTDAQFAENDGIHNDVSLVGGQPADNLAARRRFRRFTEHVRIDQVGHASLGTLMSSVVSVRFIGWNQPLTGQASNNSTEPSLRRRSFRFRRYSPRSIRADDEIGTMDRHSLATSCCYLARGPSGSATACSKGDPSRRGSAVHDGQSHTHGRVRLSYLWKDTGSPSETLSARSSSERSCQSCHAGRNSRTS